MRRHCDVREDRADLAVPSPGRDNFFCRSPIETVGMLTQTNILHPGHDRARYQTVVCHTLHLLASATVKLKDRYALVRL